MAKAIVGDPSLDRYVGQRFVQARDTLAAAVADVLGNENTVRNLGLDALDSVETSLLEIRLEADRGRIVLPKWRTIRARQSAGGGIASINKRIADLEAAISTPDSARKTEPTPAAGASRA